MAPKQLDNLARIGKLKAERPAETELKGLMRSGNARLKDASLSTLSHDSRFDLAYNAAHALSLAALRWHGYRSDNRYLVFQCLEHTVGIANAQWRVLDEAHRKRNIAEYEGALDVDDALIEALIRVAKDVQRKLTELGPIGK